MPYAFENVRATTMRGSSTAIGMWVVVIGMRDVVEVRLVDEDGRLRRDAVDAREEVARRARAGVGRGRVARVAEEHEARRRAPRSSIRSRSIVEVGVERHRAHRVAHHVGVAGALLVGRDRADQRLGARREHVRRRAQDLRRAAAEQRCSAGCTLCFLASASMSAPDGARVAARRRAGRAERGFCTASSTVLPGPERVLVAREDDRVRQAARPSARAARARARTRGCPRVRARQSRSPSARRPRQFRRSERICVASAWLSS